MYETVGELRERWIWGRSQLLRRRWWKDKSDNKQQYLPTFIFTYKCHTTVPFTSGNINICSTLKCCLVPVTNIHCHLSIMKSCAVKSSIWKTLLLSRGQSGACWEEWCSGRVKRQFELHICWCKVLWATIDVPATAGAPYSCLFKPDKNRQGRQCSIWHTMQFVISPFLSFSSLLWWDAGGFSVN